MLFSTGGRTPAPCVGSTQRTSIDMGLAGVFSTQLWHHLFIESNLADLPSRLAA